MEFTLKEIETIKDALILALDHPEEFGDEILDVIKLLDKIDNENNLD